MLGDRLREERNRMTLTRDHVARLLEISPHAIYLHESNKFMPSLGILKKYAKLYGVPTRVLLDYYHENARSPRVCRPALRRAV